MRNRLKASIMITSFVCLLAGMAMGLSSVIGAAAIRGPAIFIPQPTFNAGEIIEGKTLTHTFIIKNRGSQDLVIKNVKPG